MGKVHHVHVHVHVHMGVCLQDCMCMCMCRCWHLGIAWGCLGLILEEVIEVIPLSLIHI